MRYTSLWNVDGISVFVILISFTKSDIPRLELKVTYFSTHYLRKGAAQDDKRRSANTVKNLEALYSVLIPSSSYFEHQLCHSSMHTLEAFYVTCEIWRYRLHYSESPTITYFYKPCYAVI
jgi:hypothetical protein